MKGRLGAARTLGDARLPYTFLDERAVRGGALTNGSAMFLPSVRVLVIPHMLGL